MSYTAEQLLSLSGKFAKVSSDSLGKIAKKKEDSKKKKPEFWKKNKDLSDSNSAKDKKLDPKAEVRNRGTVCVPAESAKDKKDHFPINDEAQARNALARVNQFSSVPDWYSGSLQSLVSLVARKVKAKYPSIEVSKDAKKPGKKKSAYYENILTKLGEPGDPLGQDRKMYSINDVPADVQGRMKELAKKLEYHSANTDPAVGGNAKSYAQTVNMSLTPPSGNDNRQFNVTEMIRVSTAAAQLMETAQDPNGAALAKQVLHDMQFLGVKPGATSGGTGTTGDAAGNTGTGTGAAAKPATQRVGDPKIKKLQQILRDTYHLTGADGQPLKDDGIIGKNTRFAIESYKGEYNMPQATEAMAIYNILNTKPGEHAGRVAGGNTPEQPAAPAPVPAPGIAPGVAGSPARQQYDQTTASRFDNLINKYS